MSILGAVTVAVAASTCEQTSGYYFAGYSGADQNYNGPDMEGALAQLLYRQGAICTGDSSVNNTATAWSMIFAQDRNGWSQSGYIYDPTLPCWEHFAQLMYAGRGVPWTKKQYCVTFGVTHQAWQRIHWNAQRLMFGIEAMIDSTPFLNSTYDPLGPWDPFVRWAQPFIPAFDGEVHHTASDVPGTSTNRTEESGVMVQFFDDTWHSVCNLEPLHSDVSPGTRYHADLPSCDHARFWTQ